MIQRILLFLSLAAALEAQYPAPHAGWKLVPGGESLVTSGYWGSLFYAQSYNDSAAPPSVTITESKGVLTAAAQPSIYFEGPSPLGPWLKTSGDFGVVATIQTGANISGFITLTGSESTGTQFANQGNTVIAAGVDRAGDYLMYYQDGTNNPATYTTFKTGPGTPPTGQVTVEILHQNSQFVVYFNGTSYPPVADTGLFVKQFVMPGIDTRLGQTLEVSQFALEVPQSDTVAQLIEPVGNISYSHTGSTPGSLAPVAGKIFSVAASITELAGGGNAGGLPPNGVPDVTLAPKVIAQFGSLGVYETGWDQVEPAQGWFEFDTADAMFATARATGRTPMFCHGGLGGGADVTPYWVSNGKFTASQLTQVIQTHLQTVISRYQGLCDGWTIVNETLSDTDGTVSKGFFEQALGPSYINLALQTARAADPQLKLFITDYNIENAGVKADGMYNLISSMKQAGVPVDGVGWEGHFTLNGPQPYRPNYSQMVANMAKLATVGVVVRITELDEKILLPATAQNLADQATDYAAVVQACLDSPNCQGVQVFDADDLTSWIPGSFPGYGAATMFDTSFTPKPAYTSVMNTLEKATALKGSIYSVHTASAGAGFAQNTFIEIRGFNLVPGTTPASGVIWSSAPDFAQGKMPTNLEGVSVTVNGKPAFVYFYCSVVSSPACTLDQVNVLTPLDTSTGPVQVVVSSGSVSTSPFAATLNPVSPAFLLFNATGPIVATHADYSLLGALNLYAGASTPAKPGETVLLYGVGWGLPTNPLVNGSSTQSGLLPSAPSCQVGGAAANASIALVSPGLYQLNLTIPSTALSGNKAVTCTYGGAVTQAGAFLTVQQ